MGHLNTFPVVVTIGHGTIHNFPVYGAPPSPRSNFPADSAASFAALVVFSCGMPVASTSCIWGPGRGLDTTVMDFA